MTVAEWCVFGTLMLYLMTITPIKVDRVSLRRFDNARPRDPAFYGDPIAARALGSASERHRGVPLLRRRGVAGGISRWPASPSDMNWAILFLIVRIAYVLHPISATARRCARSSGRSALRSISRFSSCRYGAGFLPA